MINKNSNEKNSVDVIIPNYNKANFLPEAINSVLNQTFMNWKLYIIDDSSTDKSSEVLKKFEKMEKVKCIRLSKNKGPSFCRNLGMRISSSKYISFLDSDDYWKTNKLEDQINFMREKNFSLHSQISRHLFKQKIKKNS